MIRTRTITYISFPARSFLSEVEKRRKQRATSKRNTEGNFVVIDSGKRKFPRYSLSGTGSGAVVPDLVRDPDPDWVEGHPEYFPDSHSYL